MIFGKTRLSLSANTFDKILYKQTIKQVGLYSPQLCGLSFLGTSAMKDAEMALGRALTGNSLKKPTKSSFKESHPSLMNLRLTQSGPGLLSPSQFQTSALISHSNIVRWIF